MRFIPSLLIVVLSACGSKSGGGVDAAVVRPDADAAVVTPDADQSAPTCTITGPLGGTATAFDTAVTLTATATDREDGTLGGASVVWKTSLQVAPLGSGTSLPTTLPVGTNLVTCTATDSTNKIGISTSITVISKSPFAKINHPGDGETRPANQAVPFVGVARDLKDGALTGGSLVWTSSIDGMMGTGETLNRTLSVGTHTITLTATNSNSSTDTSSITLIIQ